MHRKTTQGLGLLAAALACFTIGIGTAVLAEAGQAAEAKSNAAALLFDIAWSLETTDGQADACDRFLANPTRSIASWVDMGFNPAGVQDMLKFGYATCTVSV
jgi:hypothetical protein